MDGTLASLTDGDLQKHLTPEDRFLIGGPSNKIDGAEVVGSASLLPSSPILSNVHLDTRTHLNVDETVRIASDTYFVRLD